MKLLTFFCAFLFFSCQSTPVDYTPEILSLVYNTKVGNKPYSLDQKTIFVNDQEKVNGYFADAIKRTLEHDPESKKFELTTIVQSPNWNKNQIINKTHYQLVSGTPIQPTSYSQIWVHFSNICYNESRNQAVIYYDVSCGFMCGRGNLVYLELIDGQWVISRVQNVWVS